MLEVYFYYNLYDKHPNYYLDSGTGVHFPQYQLWCIFSIFKIYN